MNTQRRSILAALAAAPVAAAGAALIPSISPVSAAQGKDPGRTLLVCYWMR